MTAIKIYRNKENPNKFIEVHNDGHYHNSVRQFMVSPTGRYWDPNAVNLTGDKKLHRWRKKFLMDLLKDYSLVERRI